MKTIVVQHQAKPERASQNQQLIEAVFAQLAERESKGFSYNVLRLEDCVSFIHVVVEHDVESPDSLQDLPAFQAFVADKPSFAQPGSSGQSGSPVWVGALSDG